MRSRLRDYDLAMPPDLASALALLARDEGWRPIAGGTDLMVLLNAGKLGFQRLVSLRQVSALKQIHVTADSVSIGAAATYSQIRSHPVLQSEFPLLCQAARWTGGVANQNQGTLGGNIANASPAADSAPALLVHDAQLHLLSVEGNRALPYADFHLGYKQLALQPHELIHSISLPRRPANWRYYSRKVGTRQAQAISKISFAAAAEIQNGQIADLRIALGCVAPVPLRCFSTELHLLGKSIVQLSIEESQGLLRAEIRPIDDMRSTAEYRSRVAQNLLGIFLRSLS